MSSTKNLSKKRKFVADGVFRAELDEFLVRELVRRIVCRCGVAACGAVCWRQQQRKK